MCFYEALERMKEKGKGQNLLTAISFFFFFPLQPKLEILCYYAHFIQILSGLVPKRENTFHYSHLIRRPCRLFKSEGFFGLRAC